jgi:hypothetical protein
MHWIDVENSPEKLLTYLQELVSSNLGKKLDSHEDGQKLKSVWTQALIGYLRGRIANDSPTAISSNS